MSAPDDIHESVLLSLDTVAGGEGIPDEADPTLALSPVERHFQIVPDPEGILRPIALEPATTGFAGPHGVGGVVKKTIVKFPARSCGQRAGAFALRRRCAKRRKAQPSKHSNRPKRAMTAFSAIF